ncbi:PP2C family protein-serine/threonine phosphatase, partial [Streptomyces sp. GC420]|uniref:PP2C family protein-serine/threonine phosphatase n=1 Tax=Streptomyces sp. GC420 TaxID=2697568 RepID=UPI0014151617
MIRTIARGESAPAGGRRARRLLAHALPGIWVVAVVLWEFLRPTGTQLIQLLAAAPAIACAGTGRRLCVLVGAVCAALALVPFDAVRHSEDAGARTGTFGAILAVVVASWLTAGRGRRLLRELERTRSVADAAQAVVLRPLPARLDGLALAAGQLSASRGAAVGGDLYEAVSCAHGVRVVMGDVRGHGLPTIGTVTALLGSFREAAHDEPNLGEVLRRLERALQRHLRDRADDTAQGRDAHLTEEFVTLLLIEVRPDGEVLTLNCGHPWPYRLNGGIERLTGGEPLPPLGPFPLPERLSAERCGQLLPGEVLFLHTDGAEDARDRRGRFFPLAGVLTEAVLGRPLPPPPVLVDSVRAALLRHTAGRPADDAALLA